MDALELPDFHRLNAAIGWLELGNAREADLELQKLSPPARTHPDVLEARWAVLAELKKWDEALPVARMLLQSAPERPGGWLHQAYALRRAQDGSLEKAWDALRPAANKFPKDSLIPYNLACYAAQMGRPDDAWEWLHRAMEAAGDVANIKAMALADPDLELLRERIEQL